MEIKHKEYKLELDFFPERETKPQADETKKQSVWFRAGYGKLYISDLAIVNVSVMKNKEDGQMFVTLPNKMSAKQKKYFNEVVIPREVSDALNYKLNNEDAPEEEAQDSNDVPWEVDL